MVSDPPKYVLKKVGWTGNSILNFQLKSAQSEKLKWVSETFGPDSTSFILKKEEKKRPIARFLFSWVSPSRSNLLPKSVSKQDKDALPLVFESSFDDPYEDEASSPLTNTHEDKNVFCFR